MTASEFQLLLDQQLAACSDSERELYARIKTPAVQEWALVRSGNYKGDGFVVAEYKEYSLLIYDADEDRFDWGAVDYDRFVHTGGSGQCRLQYCLQHLPD